MKQTIKLRESELRQMIAESVRRIIKEWDGEGDYASTGDPYGLADDEMDESNLDGYYCTFGNIWVKIKGDGTLKPQITVGSKRDDSVEELYGEEAQEILDKIKEDTDYYGDTNTAIYRNLYQIVL